MNKEMKNEDKCETCCGCSCHTKVMTGLGIVIFGLMFLAQALGWLAPEIVAIVWPILVILAGLRFFCRCCKEVCSC